MVFVGVAFLGESRCLNKQKKKQTFVLLSSITIVYAYLMRTFLDRDAITYDVPFLVHLRKLGRVVLATGD